MAEAGGHIAAKAGSAALPAAIACESRSRHAGAN
jgi:hypothetical protein